MDKNNQPYRSKASLLTNKEAKRGSLTGNKFLDSTDVELEIFFKILDNLQSPEKEQFFVEFCINPSILQ